jgi:hypothetical protein
METGTIRNPQGDSTVNTLTKQMMRAPGLILLFLFLDNFQINFPAGQSSERISIICFKYIFCLNILINLAECYVSVCLHHVSPL